MSRGEAHLWCAALVLADAGARALRLWLVVRGLGARASLAACAASNGVADLAAAVTPLRAGGLPAHVAALARRGLPAPVGTAALGVEACASYPMVALLGAALVARAGGAWWRDAGPRLAAGVRGAAWPLAAVVVALALVWWRVWWLARRRLRSTALSSATGGPATGRAGVVRRLAKGARAALARARQVAPWALAAALPLTAVQVLARVAVLPVLTRALPDPPSTPVVAVGAFGLLYSQLVLPTPSGAGAVELAGAAGAAGDLAAHSAWALGWWRAYTTLGAAAFGVPMLARLVPELLRRGRGRRANRAEEPLRNVGSTPAG